MNDQPKEVKGSKVADHVPIFQHLCPTHQWERCGVAASLVDPTKDAQHACSKKAVGKAMVFRAIAREIAE